MWDQVRETKCRLEEISEALFDIYFDQVFDGAEPDPDAVNELLREREWLLYFQGVVPKSLEYSQGIVPKIRAKLASLRDGLVARNKKR